MMKWIGVGGLIVFAWSLVWAAGTGMEVDRSIASDPLTRIEQAKFRWGTPHLDDRGNLILADESNEVWKSVGLPTQIRNSGDASTLLVQMELPIHQWRDPSIYFNAWFDARSLKLYLPDQLFLECTLPGCPGSLPLQHIGLIPYPEGSSGKTLTVELQVDNGAVVTLDEVLLGSQTDLVVHLLRRYASGTMVGFLLVVVGAFQLFVSIKSRERRTQWTLACFILTSGLWTFLDGPVIGMITRADWTVDLLICSVLLMPATGSAFFEVIFGKGPFYSIRLTWIIFLVYAIGGILLFASELVTIRAVVIPFQILSLPLLGVLVANAIHQAVKGNFDAKLFMLGILLMALGVSRDILIDVGILTGIVSTSPWGLFGYILCMGLILERHYGSIQRNLKLTNEASSRFVPYELLNTIGKKSIIDLRLGDHVEAKMTILFADIRSFTSMSEQFTPEVNFQFINTYLSQMGPIIRRHNGFIDKYIGDAIMALFSKTPDDALRSAINMLIQLKAINHNYQQNGWSYHEPIRIGIGINTGELMMGAIGEENRLEGTVIGDSVNLAARIEGMTKHYGISLLISEWTFQELQEPQLFCIRMLDRVIVKGKQEPVSIYEVFDADPDSIRSLKLKTLSEFETGVKLFHQKQIDQAKECFLQCLSIYPDDSALKVYLERCRLLKQNGISWEEIMEIKFK